VNQKAQAVAALGDLTVGIAQDKKEKAALEAALAAKTEAHGADRKVREEELAAVKEALQVLRDPKLAAAYAANVDRTFLQTAPALLQLSSASQGRSAARSHAAELLQSRAAALSSVALDKLAGSVRAEPFAKVVGMIRTLLGKLRAEAAAEQAHKDYCDKELHENKLSSEKTAAAVERLSATAAQGDAQINALAEDISEAQDSQAAASKALADATDERAEEKAANAKAIEETVAGQKAVKLATQILSDFYAKAQANEEAAYEGQVDKKTGVIALLNTMASALAREEANARAAEAESTSTFARLKLELQTKIKLTAKREHALTLEKDQEEHNNMLVKKDLASEQQELKELQATYAVLEDQCITIHASYEKRTQARKEEIAALKEAYAILDETD